MPLLQQSRVPKVGLNAAQQTITGRICTVLPYASVYQTVNPRQDSTLPAQGKVADLKQVTIPDNQWMVGLSHWFGAGLAQMQRGIAIPHS
jgi:hypothetical protein